MSSPLDRTLPKAVTACIALLVSSLCRPAAGATGQDFAGFPGMEPLGMDQGKFVVEVLQKAGGERLFPRTMTRRQAGDALAGVGFAPFGGWAVDAPLTRRDLDAAYQRLLGLLDVTGGVAPHSDVVLLVHVDDVAPRAGAGGRCTVAAGNVGWAAAEDVRVSIIATGGIRLTAPGVAGFDADSGTWRLGRLEPATVIRLAMDCAVPPGTEGQRLQVNARVLVPEAEPGHAARADASAGMMVYREGATIADVGLLLGVDNLLPSTGDKLVFSLTVTNRGPSVASGVMLTNRVPPELAGVTYPEAWRRDNGRLADIPPLSAVHMSFTAEVGRCSKELWALTNIVQKIAMQGEDPESGNDAASVELLVRFTERVGAAVQRAIVPTTTERQPVSPSRPLRR